MCATVVWAIDHRAFTAQFQKHTRTALGVEPQATDYRIASKRTRLGATHFTLTRRVCDCDGLVGLRSRDLHDEETSAAAVLGWIQGLAGAVPGVTRLSFLRAWSPETLAVKPRRAAGIRVDEVDEALLRQVGDDALVTIDYPCS